VVRLKRRKNGWGRGLQGSATREAQWRIGLWTMGQGIDARPHRTPLDNQSTSRVDGRAKWQAAAGSLAPWRTRQNTDWGRDHRPDHRPPVGAARHLSGLSCCLYRQTEAAAFAPM